MPGCPYAGVRASLALRSVVSPVIAGEKASVFEGTAHSRDLRSATDRDYDKSTCQVTEIRDDRCRRNQHAKTGVVEAVCDNRFRTLTGLARRKTAMLEVLAHPLRPRRRGAAKPAKEDATATRFAVNLIETLAFRVPIESRAVPLARVSRHRIRGVTGPWIYLSYFLGSRKKRRTTFPSRRPTLRAPFAAALTFQRHSG